MIIKMILHLADHFQQMQTEVTAACGKYQRFRWSFLLAQLSDVLIYVLAWLKKRQYFVVVEWSAVARFVLKERCILL
jgi:hypothetical protein